MHEHQPQSPDLAALASTAARTVLELMLAATGTDHEGRPELIEAYQKIQAVRCELAESLPPG